LLPLRARLKQGTGILLILFAAGLVTHSVHEFNALAGLDLFH
jgi:hypothetical protein